MSLEAAMAENTAALKALTEQLQVSNVNRAAALETLTGAAAPKAGRTKKADPEPAVEDLSGEKGAEKVREAFATYMDVADDTEKQARKAKLKLILAKFEVGKSVEIPEKSRAQALGWVKTLMAGENVPEIEPTPVEDDDDM